MRKLLYSTIFCLIFFQLLSCATTPVIPVEYDNNLRIEVEKNIREYIKFDPYGNTIYYSDAKFKNIITTLYDSYLTKIRTEVPNGNSYYGGFLSYGTTRPNAQQYLTIEDLSNYIKRNFNLSNEESLVASKSIYSTGWALVKNGHAIERGDLALYEVPLLFIYYRIWTGGFGPVLEGSCGYFTMKLESKIAPSIEQQESKKESSVEDVSKRLKALDELKEKGLITDDEYIKQREKIISNL